jgi:hypothetical protein
MKVATSRMLVRANNLLLNAAIGEFPNVQQPKEPVNWRSGQQQRLDQAVSEGKWRPLFDHNDILNQQ